MERAGSKGEEYYYDKDRPLVCYLLWTRVQVMGDC